MPTYISLSVTAEAVPVADVITSDAGRSFLVLRFGPEFNIYIPGFGPEAVAYARRTIEALKTAAEDLEARPVPQIAPEPDASAVA